MAKERAKEFLEHLLTNPKTVEQMKGFTVDDMRSAAEELKKEGKIDEKSLLMPPDAI